MDGEGGGEGAQSGSSDARESGQAVEKRCVVGVSFMKEGMLDAVQGGNSFTSAC